MALERQSIEKRDFPIGRRGYDPDAVDAHLSALADEVDELKASSRKRTETLATTASEQVRAIVDAAENSAAEIQRQAEEEAREIKAEALAEAQSARERATAQARDYVGKVAESTAVMLQRLDAMESELNALTEALRGGATRLGSDLELLQGNLGDVDRAVVRPKFEPDTGDGEVGAGTPPPAPPPAAAEVDATADIYAEQAAPELDQPVADDEVVAVVEIIEEVSLIDGEGEAAGDSESARLIALNMAMMGTPRDETDRYLAENFDLPDRDTLLDEVYASAEN